MTQKQNNTQMKYKPKQINFDCKPYLFFSCLRHTSILIPICDDWYDVDLSYGTRNIKDTKTVRAASTHVSVGNHYL